MILDGYWKKELKRNIRNLKLCLKFSFASSKFVEHQVSKV